MMQNPMHPICEELIIYHMQKEVKEQNWFQLNRILNLRKVGIPDFNDIDDRGLPSNVKNRPFDVMIVGLLLVLVLQLFRSEL